MWHGDFSLKGTITHAIFTDAGLIGAKDAGRFRGLCVPNKRTRTQTCDENAGDGDEYDMPHSARQRRTAGMRFIEKFRGPPTDKRLILLPDVDAKIGQIQVPKVVLDLRRKPVEFQEQQGAKPGDVDVNKRKGYLLEGGLEAERWPLTDCDLDIGVPDVDSVRARLTPEHLHKLPGGLGRAVNLAKAAFDVPPGTRMFVITHDFCGAGTMKAPLHLQGDLCQCLKRRDTSTKIGACAKDALAKSLSAIRIIDKSNSLFGVVK